MKCSLWWDCSERTRRALRSPPGGLRLLSSACFYVHGHRACRQVFHGTYQGHEVAVKMIHGSLLKAEDKCVCAGLQRGTVWAGARLALCPASPIGLAVLASQMACLCCGCWRRCVQDCAALCLLCAVSVCCGCCVCKWLRVCNVMSAAVCGFVLVCFIARVAALPARIRGAWCRKRLYMERFIDEAKMMSRLHHPNLQLLLGAWPAPRAHTLAAPAVCPGPRVRAWGVCAETPASPHSLPGTSTCGLPHAWLPVGALTRGGKP